MIIQYRRFGSSRWETALFLAGYGELGAFVLRWQEQWQDYDEVLVPWNRVALPNGRQIPRAIRACALAHAKRVVFQARPVILTGGKLPGISRTDPNGA